jgi:hypothetical protein
MKRPIATRRSVFISYRRSDTDALAGRIKDRLEALLPAWDVFMDVASVEPGADFHRAIDERVLQSSVVIVLIGTRWAGDDGTRIRDAADLVRHEVKLSLANGVRIIPVLVNGARMPDKLPDDIAALTRRNAIELRHARFDDDFTNLATAIAGADLGASGRGRRPGIAAPRSAALGALLGLGTALATLVLHFELTGRAISERIGDDGATLLIPAFVIAGAAIGYLLAARRRS